jgi:hypothetical protein
VSGGEGIAVGDDYTRAQQGPSAPHMLFNPRTGRLEPTNPPPKDTTPRIQQQQQQQQQQQRVWGLGSKVKPASADALSAAPASARSILKAPTLPSSSRPVPDPKSLREEAR